MARPWIRTKRAARGCEWSRAVVAALIPVGATVACFDGTVEGSVVPQPAQEPAPEATCVDARPDGEVCVAPRCGFWADHCGGLRDCGVCESPACEDPRPTVEICGAATCGTKRDACDWPRSCGSCAAPAVCEGGTCVLPDCTDSRSDADVCAATTVACGTATDVCNRPRVCPDCPLGRTCVAGVCICLDDRTDGEVCAAAGLACGLAADRCDAQRPCGGCPGDESCANGRCVPPQCVPDPRSDAQVCAEGGRVCGQLADDCGALRACGECAATESCREGQCGCIGTGHKWESPSATNAAPVISANDPALCLVAADCLYSDGTAAQPGATVAGASTDWLCSVAWVEGREQGVWFGCEATRAGVAEVRDGLLCVWNGSRYLWCADQRSDAEVCGATASECGSTVDECGRTRSCGECTPPAACNAGRCVACDDGRSDDDVCAARGAECGTVSDDCGTPRNCGGCGAAATCLEQQCVCPGTERRWVSSRPGQVGQAVPPYCVTAEDCCIPSSACIAPSGESAPWATLLAVECVEVRIGDSVVRTCTQDLCDEDTVEGRSQGVWRRCGPEYEGVGLGGRHCDCETTFPSGRTEIRCAW